MSFDWIIFDLLDSGKMVKSYDNIDGTQGMGAWEQSVTECSSGVAAKCIFFVYYILKTRTFLLHFEATMLFSM